MADFKSQLRADLDQVFINPDEYALTASYLPYTGSARNINGIFDNEFETVDPDTQVTIIERGPIFRVAEHIFGPGEPGPYDQVTIDGDIYRIKDSEPDGVGTVVLFLEKIQ